MSHDYDFTSKIYDPLLYPALRGIRGAVTRALASHKHSKILDLCCGTGNQLKILSRAGFTDLHCLDISPGMLKVAGRGRPDYRIYEADARSTGFDDGMFDVVILSFAIHEKEPDTQRAMIGEAHRVLKKDGLLLVVDYLFDKKSFAPARAGVTAVERIAGKEHYINFRNYMKNGGLCTLLPTKMWRFTHEQRRLLGTVTVAQYNKV